MHLLSEHSEVEREHGQSMLGEEKWESLLSQRYYVFILVAPWWLFFSPFINLQMD